MLVNSSDLLQIQDPKPSPTREEDWHVWPVTIPRRSITGRLVWGTVLRRRKGRGWIYKKYVEQKS
jgi:hypothetical protein